MIEVAKRFWRGVGGCLPTSFWIRHFAGNRVALMYHVVSDNPPPHIRHLYPCKTPVQLHEDIQEARKSFVFVDYDTFAAPRTPERPQALLTFDDGLRECIDVVSPLLDDLSCPALFFITTQWLDNRNLGHDHLASLCIQRVVEDREARASAQRFVSRRGTATSSLEDSIRALATHENTQVLQDLASVLGVRLALYLKERQPYVREEDVKGLIEKGHAVGAHSTRHQHLYAMETATVMRDIAESCARIADISGKSNVPYAFPYTAAAIGDRLDRGKLDEMGVGMIFGTDGVRRHPIIRNRVPMDKPPPQGLSGTDLPSFVRSEGVRLSLASFGRRLRD